MATRNAAGKIQELIDAASNFEALAGAIQGNDEAAGESAAAKLRAEYRSWYSSSLAVLPEDLRDRFRKEYEGGTLSWKIKKFLEEPRRAFPVSPDTMTDASREIFNSPWSWPYEKNFIHPLNEQVSYLYEALSRLGIDAGTADSLELLENISRKLPESLSILAEGARSGRAGLVVNDEYDLQHILHSITVLHFEEVQAEEPTPTMGGRSSRLDFLLKRERLAIETKMTRESLTLPKLREELASDVAWFRGHPHVQGLFILIYDPKRRIRNSTGVENDLNSLTGDDFTVRAVIIH
ncbi:hypothetical protein [Nocardia testacea]|uniref:PD-(D/E)XK nuclease domain-containing protein n=1 Tax=Nocardia testacea TaxID=248551 RepID=UPI0012F6BA60|nr:hypothetical protein [Nocardia testacea]